MIMYTNFCCAYMQEWYFYFYLFQLIPWGPLYRLQVWVSKHLHHWHFGLDNSFLLCAVLCMVECSTASLVPKQQIVVAPHPPRLSRWQPKCLQTLPSVPWGNRSAKSLLVENHSPDLPPAFFFWGFLTSPSGSAGQDPRQLSASFCSQWPIYLIHGETQASFVPADSRNASCYSAATVCSLDFSRVTQTLEHHGPQTAEHATPRWSP